MIKNNAPQAVTSFVAWLSGDLVLRRLRWLISAVSVVVMALALSRVPWLFLATEPTMPAPTFAAEPLQQAARQPVDLASLQSWYLFGVGTDAEESTLSQAIPAKGIEDNAQETRLELVLVGVLAARDDGLGQAIIEYRRSQAIYRVGDSLPVPGRVSLAKVLPDRVVLDNNSTYELLMLYDRSDIGARLVSTGQASNRRSVADPMEVRSNAAAREQSTTLNATERSRYYENPEALAEIVAVGAHRDASGQLIGYRVTPGARPDQFNALGFKAGDLVTSVNGLMLSEPSNALMLYQLLREASVAEFVIQRGDTELTLTVEVAESGP
jgi:Type II secretory pathway, component PulC